MRQPVKGRNQQNLEKHDNSWLNTPENRALEYVSQNQGQALDVAARAFIEPQFAHDFANVRIFADGQAPDLADKLDARAFTIGQNIVFAQNEYQPHSRDGQGLIAHELAHTVQQRNVNTKSVKHLEIADQNSVIETEARAASANTFSGQAVQIPSSSGAVIARETKDQHKEPADDARKYTQDEEAKLHEENAKVAFETAASVLLQKHGDQIKNWEHLNIAQRQALCETTIEALNHAFTKAQGVKDPENPYPKPRPNSPDLVVDPKMPADRPGENREKGKIIALNPEHLKTYSYEQMLDTIGHEFTHTQQYRQADNSIGYISPQHGRTMLKNSYNYVQPEESKQKYLDQPMEADARKGGTQFSDAFAHQKEGNEQIQRVQSLHAGTEIHILKDGILQINGQQLIKANELSIISDSDLKTMLQVSEKVKRLHPDSKLQFGDYGTVHINSQTEISAKELAKMSDKDVQALLKASHELNQRLGQKVAESPQKTSSKDAPTKPQTTHPETEKAEEAHHESNPDLTLSHQVGSSNTSNVSVRATAGQSAVGAVSPVGQAVQGQQPATVVKPQASKPISDAKPEPSKAAVPADNVPSLNDQSKSIWNISDKGLTGTKTDGTTTVNQNVTIEGGALKLEQRRDIAVDGHAMNSSFGMKLGPNAVQANWGHGSSTKDLETGAVEGEQKANSMGFGKDGFSASRSSSQTTEIDGQKFSTGSSTSYSAGNITRTTTNSQTSTNEAGQEVNTGSSHGYSVGRDGVAYNASKTDAKGNTTAANVSANAGLDSSGNLNNLQLGAGISRNNKSVSVHAGYQVEASEPRQQGETWVVDWSRNLSAGGKAGGSKGAGNIGAGANYSDSEFGTRGFKNKDEATAFQKDAAARLPSHAHDPSTANGALHLEIGESRGHGHGVDGSVSGGLSMAGGGNIGVGLQGGSSSSLSVHRVSASLFEVTDESGSNKGVSLSAGTLGAGATGHSSTDHSSSRTLRFDLSTPEGRAAFDAYNKDPSQIPATGAHVVSSTEMKGESSGTTVNLPGHKHDRTSRVEEAVTQDDQGKLERYTGKATEQISTNIPFFDKTHDNVGVQFDATERNDRNSQYALTGSVDSSEGSDSIRHLAALTSSAYRSSKDATSSGKWGVEVEITEAMVEQFTKEIGTERVLEMGFFDNTRNELREHLRDAKTSDDKKRALARFFADDGHDGKAIKQMREVLTGGYANAWSIDGDYESMKRNKRGNLNYDLTLPGDRNFKGMGARLELEGKIKQYQQLIANPTTAGTLHGEIAPLLEEVRRQRNEINDPKRYSDLPDELREHQVARLDGYIEALNSLRAQAGEAIIEADAPTPNKKGNQAAPTESGPLKELGQDIAEWSSNIKNDQTEYQVFKSEYGTLRQRQAHQGVHLGNGNAIAKMEQEALHFAESAQKMTPRIDDLRSEYLQLRGNPAQATKALEVGGKLKESLEEQSDLWQSARNGMENVKTRLDTMLEEATDAKADQPMPAQSMSMRLPEPKKSKRR